jgi:hypothetical protein
VVARRHPVPHTDAVGREQRELLTARGIRIVEGPVTRLVIDNDQLQGVASRSRNRGLMSCPKLIVSPVADMSSVSVALRVL